MKNRLLIAVACCMLVGLHGTALAAEPAQKNAKATVPAAVKLLKVEPVRGHAGDKFTVSGEGLAPGKTVELTWTAASGAYVTRIAPDNVEYHERKYDLKRVPLGGATVDAAGRLKIDAVVPEDFGEDHDIHAVIDGKDAARGGFRILRSATMEPKSGPVGTPITITVKGLGWRGFEQFMALRYDNRYTGMISAITTRGTAVFQIRASGNRGKRIIQLNNSTATGPGAYLNTQQSPQDYIYAHIDNKQEFRFVFDVTGDSGAPPNRIQWPHDDRVAKLASDAPRTTMSAKFATNVNLDPVSGPILSRVSVRAKGLPPKSEIGLHFVTARGNRMGPSGWNLQSVPLGKAVTAADGSLSANVQIPDDLGGWHVIRLASRDKVLAETPFYVEHSLVEVSPRRVKAGETFTITLKGVGWTELDNTVADTYDNAAMGYACGFNTNGDVTMNLVATGEPGTHLIDIYPAIYKGKDRVPLNYQTPFLTFERDYPGLALGYRLPAYRLAIEVVE